MEGKQTANRSIKKLNRSKIFQLIRSQENLTKQDLVFKLNLSLPTITQNLTQMIQCGLIQESGFVGNTGGRSAKTYSLVRDAQVAIGLDITKHHVIAVIIDLYGTIIYKIRKRLVFERTDAYYQQLSAIVSELIEQASIDPQKILGVGLGLPGLVCEGGSRIFYGKVLDLTNMTIDEIAKYIPYPASLHHDAYVAGFAETWMNPDSTMKNAFYVLINNSIGGSFIYKGEVYSGEMNRSAEIGHVKIIPNGRRCYCGGTGCTDPYISVSNLSELTDGNLEAFFDLLSGGDPAAEAKWQNYLSYLTLAMHNIHILLDCPVILGGYLGQYMGKYIDDLNQRVSELDPFEDHCTYIQGCIYKNEAVAVGAALTYIDTFVNSI